MTKNKRNEQAKTLKKPAKIIPINLNRGHITVSSLSPIVVMKRLSRRFTDTANSFKMNSLPELHKEDEIEELSQEVQDEQRRKENLNIGHITVNSLSPIVMIKRISRRFTDTATSFKMGSLPELHKEVEREELILDAQDEQRKKEKQQHQSVENELTFIDTMTNDELNDHIQKCLQMSSENKITPKNAFALQLIDCMSFLMETKKDFSIMACTLDAGAKIYSYRVDALHQQVTRLAEEVVQHQRQKGNSDSKKYGDSDPNERNKKEKRKPNKCKILVSSESLRRKLKGKDPKDRFIKVDALPGAIISEVRRDQKDLSFSLENDLPFWPNWDGNYKPLRAEGTVTLPLFEVFRSKTNSKSPKERVDYNDNFSEKEVISQEPHVAGEALKDINDANNSEEATVNHTNGDTSPSEDVEVISTVMKRLNEETGVKGGPSGATTRFEAMKIVFDEHSDYHYLDMKNVHYWAGPEFWKRPRPGNQVGKETQKVKRKRKQPAEISYDFDVKTLDKKWSQSFKRGTTLKKNTIIDWKNNKLTLPNDLKVDITLFFDLFHIKAYKGLEDKTHTERELYNEEGDPSGKSENGMLQSSQDTLKFSFYDGGPVNSQGSQNSRDPLNSAFYDVGLIQRKEQDHGKLIKVQITSEMTDMFGETTMVPAPKIVRYEPIKYSTRPIRVDMQHLKHTMMDIINEQVERDAIEKQGNNRGWLRNISSAMPGTTLTSILRSLPGRLEERTSQDLSPAIAFLALLTLANENNLQLRNTEDSDVRVNLENNVLMSDIC